MEEHIIRQQLIDKIEAVTGMLESIPYNMISMKDLLTLALEIGNVSTKLILSAKLYIKE